MKTDLEVEVEVDLRHLGKVIIFRDKQTDRTFLLYIDPSFDHQHHHYDDHEAVKARLTNKARRGKYPTGSRGHSKAKKLEAGQSNQCYKT